MRTIRVLIDARMCDGRHDGVSRYVTRLLRELRGPQEIIPVALCPESVPAGLKDLEVELCTTDFTRAHRPAHQRLWWEQTRLPGILRRVRPDLYHATWNTGIPIACPVPAVLTLHDLIPLADPRGNFPSRWHRWSYLTSLGASVRRADRIITVSHYVRDDCLRRLGLPAERITAIHNGVDSNVERSGILGPPATDYVLYVGGPEQRKNGAAVFAAMNSLWRRTGGGPELWLTGALERQSPDARAAYENSSHKERVQFLGSPDDAELQRLMASARALLLLSLAEGFGLPALEAMACGCPVIVSNRASLPEVVADAGVIVDPDDPAAVADAVLRVLGEDRFRADLVERERRRAAEFSWARTAEQTVTLYQEVLAGRHQWCSGKGYP